MQLHLQSRFVGLSKEPVIDSDITLENRSLWWTSLTLYEDELVLSGWTWTGFQEERIPLGQVDLVEKWTVSLGPNIRVHTTDDRSAIFGRIHDGVKFWELALEKHEGIELRLRH